MIVIVILIVIVIVIVRGRDEGAEQTCSEDRCPMSDVSHT